MLVQEGGVDSLLVTLNEAAALGHKWVAYNERMHYTEPDSVSADLHFFRTIKDANRFCIDNSNASGKYAWSEIKPLVDTMAFLAEGFLELEKVNGYYDIKKGIGSESVVINEYRSLQEINAELLAVTLRRLGVDGIDRQRIEKELKKDNASFDIGTMKMMDEDKVKLLIHFQKTDRPWYAIPGYDTVFYQRIAVEHAVINGVDTKALEEKMKNADWYYAYTESDKAVAKEYNSLEQIEKEINLLGSDEDGKRIATQLWNNHVPFYALTKPDFIREYEQKSDMYLRQTYTGDTPVEDAYRDLNRIYNEKFESLQPESTSPEIHKENFVQEDNWHGLYSPEGNAFTDALMDHWDLQANNSIKLFFSETTQGEIKAYLVQQRAEGNRWVAYNAGAAVITKDELHCFQSNYDVQEFCYENNTDRDFYTADSIAFIEHELDKWSKFEVNVPDIIQLAEEKMKKADWYYANADAYSDFQSGEKDIREIKYLLQMIRKDAGLEQAQKLWDKYAPENSVSKPDFLINKKQDVMTEKEMVFIQNQFKSVGALEAFNEDLIKQLKNGVPNIAHAYSKKYEGDGEAKAVFHLKKSDNSNLYFLNKWDQTAIKEGEANGLTKTFYNNHFHKNSNNENRDPDKYYASFTFKSSYNYLQGRPVYNTHKNGKDQQYQSWDVLNPKKIENGKPEEKQYHQNYPFDLKKVMNNYSIQELTNDTYAQRLYESVQRGNLQLATFVAEGGAKEKLFISPNIPLNALKVYDKDKHPVPTQTLVEKGYIATEFAEKLKERVEAFKQKNGIDTPQKQAPVQKSEQQEKNTPAKEEKEGETAGKGNRQRQTNNQTQRQRKLRHKHQQ